MCPFLSCSKPVAHLFDWFFIVAACVHSTCTVQACALHRRVLAVYTSDGHTLLWTLVLSITYGMTSSSMHRRMQISGTQLPMISVLLTCAV